MVDDHQIIITSEYICYSVYHTHIMFTQGYYIFITNVITKLLLKTSTLYFNDSIDFILSIYKYSIREIKVLDYSNINFNLLK